MFLFFSSFICFDKRNELTYIFVLFFLMDPNDNDTAKYKCMTSELTSHPLHSPQKKKSNSINGELDNVEKYENNNNNNNDNHASSL